MFSVDEKIKMSRMTLEERIKYRKINSDSSAYSHIDEKCDLCNTKITKEDVTLPNQVFENKNYVVHGNCLEYCLKKYPRVPFTDLMGKIVRVKNVI